MKLGPLAACILLAVLPAACTAMSTYPPVDGKPVSTPNVSPGPEVMAGAIREAARLVSPGKPIIFNLPAGLSEHTWNRVAFLLPDTARAMEAEDEEVFSVKQLRISGGSAEVDVVYRERSVYQLMTVKMSGGAIAGWSVAWSYRWLLPEQKPTPNDPLQKSEMAQVNETAPAASTKATEEDNVK